MPLYGLSSWREKMLNQVTDSGGLPSLNSGNKHQVKMFVIAGESVGECDRGTRDAVRTRCKTGDVGLSYH